MKPSVEQPHRSLRLLVLSDIHAGPKNKDPLLIPLDDMPAHHPGRAGTEGMAGAFLKLVKDLQPDFIVVPGDLTTSATFGQFKSTFNFLAKVCQAAGLHPAALIVVPGNHDSDWMPSAHFRGQSMSEEAEARHDQRYWPARHAAEKAGLGCSTALFSPEHYDIVVMPECAFLLLNSAAHDGPGIVHHGAVSDATIKAIQTDTRWPKDARPKIAVLHHHLVSFGSGPPYDVSALQNAQDYSRLLEDLGVDFVIHGHKHVPRTSHVYGGRKHIPCLVSGTFSGEIHEAEVFNVFHLIDLETCGSKRTFECSARGTIQTFCWLPHGGWKPVDNDAVQSLDHFGTHARPEDAREAVEACIKGKPVVHETTLRSSSDLLRWLQRQDLLAAMEGVAKSSGMVVMKYAGQPGLALVAGGDVGAP